MSGRIKSGMLALVVTGLLGGAVANAGGVELKPVYNSDAYYLEIKEETVQELKADMIGPDPVEMKSSSLYGLMETLRTTEEGGELTFTFDRRMMTFNNPMMGGMMEFDTDTATDSSDDNSMSLIAMPYVGKKLTATLNAEGEVQEFKGWDDLSDAIEESAMGDMFYEQARSSINEKSLQGEVIEWRYQMLPNKKVDVGDTWERVIKDENPMMGKVVTTYKCKLDKVDGKKAHISFSSTTQMQEGAEAPTNPMGMKPELKNLGADGTAIYNFETGQMVAGKLNTSGAFEMNMPNVEGQTLSVKIKGKTTVRSLSVKDREKEKAQKKAG